MVRLLDSSTIFRQVDVTFQKTQVSHTGTNYPYKAYIDAILKTNLSTQENLLTSQLFYKDKGPDTNNAKTGSNGGLFERAVATIGGKIVDLEGPLFSQSYQSQPLQPNYEADQFMDCYRTLTHFRKDINVSRADYKSP